MGRPARNVSGRLSLRPFAAAKLYGHSVAKKSYRPVFDVPLRRCKTIGLVSCRVAETLEEKTQHGQIVYPVHEARGHPAQTDRRARIKGHTQTVDRHLREEP